MKYREVGESQSSFWGSRNGIVVRVLVSVQCVLIIQFPDPASHVGWVCCWFSTPAQRGFSSGTQVFFSPQKPTFSNSTLILECRGIFERVLVNSLVLRGYWQITYLHILLHFITKHWACMHMRKVSTCIPLGWSRSGLWSKITWIMVCQGTDSWIYSRLGFIG